MKKDSNFRFYRFHWNTDIGSCRENGDIEVLGLAAGSNIKIMEEQIRNSSRQIVAVWSEEKEQTNYVIM